MDFDQHYIDPDYVPPTEEESDDCQVIDDSEENPRWEPIRR